MPALGVSSHLSTGAANQFCQCMNEPGIITPNRQKQLSDACLCDKFCLTSLCECVCAYYGQISFLYMILKGVVDCDFSFLTLVSV